ncbi:uncharacterized protein LOC110857928 [Folsomia candida]|uniref:uncharacterized protein LOC110857928 n=1 Tax=Folsomia candida TaxID=158441 RepID=UPI001604AA20|nr:uncharacterized protein LOC110857928 [Folsomia candida]
MPVTFLRITLGTNSDLNFVQKLIGFFPRLETLEIILAEFSIGQNADIVVKSTPSENPTLLKSLIIRIAKESKIAFAEKKNEIVMLCEILGINVIQNVDRIYLEDSGRLLPYMFYLYDWKKLTRVHFPYACQEILEKLTLLPSSLNELKLDNISNLYWLEKVMTRHMSSIVILDVSLFTDDITHPEQSEFPKLSRLEKLSYSIGKRNPNRPWCGTGRRMGRLRGDFSSPLDRLVGLDRLNMRGILQAGSAAFKEKFPRLRHLELKQHGCYLNLSRQEILFSNVDESEVQIDQIEVFIMQLLNFYNHELDSLELNLLSEKLKIIFPNAKILRICKNNLTC